MTQRILIIGDTLLDRDVEGVVTRLCPDAPVPVLDENRNKLTLYLNGAQTDALVLDVGEGPPKPGEFAP